MIQLPNNEKCYNLPEQVAQNLLNIKYLAEQYANIDSLPTAWKAYKDQFDEDFDTFGDWTTTFEGWDTTLAGYLASMSSAAVGAIAGQAIAPASITVSGDCVFNGDVTGTKITGVYEGVISSTLTAAGLTVVASYVKAVRNFNELQFIFNCRLANNTGSTITIGNDTPLAYFNDLTSELKSKIYAHNGQPCSSGTQGPVAMALLLIATTGGQVNSALIAQLPRYVDLYHITDNFVFYIEGGTFDILANTTYDFEARISLAL